MKPATEIRVLKEELARALEINEALTQQYLSNSALLAATKSKLDIVVDVVNNQGRFGRVAKLRKILKK